MKASETKLQQIIEGVKQYVVPLFQRPYSWDSQQWGALWDDIMELCEEERSRTHFIGSIVTVPALSVPEGVPKFTLIDGQQRMTTVFLLLAAIRARAHEQNVGTLAPEIEQTLLRNMFKEGYESLKLLPTQGDRETFVQVMNGQAPDTDGKVMRGWRFYLSKLRNMGPPELEKLKRVIVNNLILVSIVLDRDDNPHLIFESLNAKGQPLSQADLIRNYFFMRMRVGDQEQLYRQFWKPMQDSLGGDLTECIRHFLMKDGAIVRQGDVYFALKERADDLSSTERIVGYLESLAQFAGYYSRLLRPDEEPSLRIRERMSRLNRIEVTTAYPFLLNVYHDYASRRLSEDAFVGVLDVLENFMIRRWVCAVPTYGLNKVFPPLYSQARQAGDLVEGVKEALRTKNYPRDAEFRDRMTAAKLYGPAERTTKTKLILERIEESFAHHEPVDFGPLTIEHIMPQTLTDWWQNHLGERWESVHELLLHTLGNLTLTGYNELLSNDPFSKKRSVLANSHLELNRGFAVTEAWDEQTIRDRADFLANRAVCVWPYFGVEQGGSEISGGDVTGRTPIAVTVLGQRFACSTWRDVAQRTLEAIADVVPEKFDLLLAQFPKFVGRDPSAFRSSRPLKNGMHMLTNLSAVSIRKLCIQVTEAALLSSEDWLVEFA